MPKPIKRFKNIKYTRKTVERNSADGKMSHARELHSFQQLSDSTEVVLHELGESIAVSVASIQRELARYPNTLGAYLLDEMELNIPVRMWLDNLGQVMVNVVANEPPGPVIGQLHLKIRPVLGVTEPPPVTSGQSLSALGVFTPEDISRLEAQRIFSVDDLLRVTRHASGHAGLAKSNLQADLNIVLERAALLSLPMLPSLVAESLLRIGIQSPSDFVKQDPQQIADLLSQQLDQVIQPEHVKAWQDEVRKFIALPLPNKI